MFLTLWRYSLSTLFMLTLAWQLVKLKILCNKMILQRSAFLVTLALSHNFQNAHYFKEYEYSIMGLWVMSIHLISFSTKRNRAWLAQVDVECLSNDIVILRFLTRKQLVAAKKLKRTPQPARTIY